MKSCLSKILILAIGLFFGALIGRSELAPPSLTTPQGELEIRMMVDDGDGSIDVYREDREEGESLFSFMKRLEEKTDLKLTYEEFEGLGVLISQIGKKKNGEEEKYWQYWINNEHAKVGADSYLLQGGENIEWKFAIQQDF